MPNFLWEPLLGLDAVRREMERLFAQFDPAQPSYARSAFLPGISARAYPLVNVTEDRENVYVEALAPGLSPDSIEVSVLQDQLRIAGVKTPINPNVKPEAFHRNERGAGRFARVIALPTAVEGDKVQAEYKNGLLYLRLPKHAEAKPKQISVKVQ